MTSHNDYYDLVEIGAGSGGLVGARFAAQLGAKVALGMKISDLAGTIHPYPTYSTGVQQMAADITVEHFLSGTLGTLVRGLSRAIR